VAHLVELIFTTEIAGSGVEGDPIRCRPQLWTKDGQLVAESDPATGKGFFNWTVNLGPPPHILSQPPPAPPPDHK
jgi:hypothetical protein